MTTQHPNAESPMLARFKGELASLYGSNLDRVVLFGSRARGDHGTSSDYDIAVFLKNMPDRWAEIDRLIALNCPIWKVRMSFWT